MIGHYRGGYDFSGLVKRARELRKKQTSAEELFWELVRNRKFLGLKFRRQHQIGNYILDFYCYEKKLAIEFDGSVHENRQKKDAKRDAYLSSLGIKVFRIPNKKLLDNPEQTLQRIFGQLPSPSGRGVGGEGRFSAPLNRKGHILMIDARNIYRKVTRKIYDFSPEQLQNILSIIWLYRGETKRFHRLVWDYISAMLNEAAQSIERTRGYETIFGKLNKELQPFLSTLSKVETQNFASLRQHRKQNTFGPQSKNLASIIRGFKIGVKKHASINNIFFTWQSRFYDHIIHNDKDLNGIRQYIANNPVNWASDELFQSSGKNVEYGNSTFAVPKMGQKRAPIWSNPGPSNRNWI